MLIPRANVLANVAAKNPVADILPKLLGDSATQLNSEVADASRRVQHVRLRERVGGTCVQASRTCAAVIQLKSFVVFQFQIGEQRREKETNYPLSD